ncbi:MAG: glycosyltransferase, partial [Acidimicrobiales bacterium]
MRVAALVPNLPGLAPGQRVRIESWTGYLEGRGWTVDLYPFESEQLHEVIYRRGRGPAKARGLAVCYYRQLRRVLTMPRCDVLFVYREAALVGPAVLERLAARTGAPFLYDLDDPTFVRYRSPTSGWASLLKFHGKTHGLFRRADHVIAINDLIGDYATRYNPSVTVIPNFVDTEKFVPAAAPPPDPVRLVWIGSHTTAPNLVEIAPALARLQADRDVVLCAVGAGDMSVPGVKVEARPWSSETELADLHTGHVGLVPLNDLPWNRWKFFFKTVQY